MIGIVPRPSRVADAMSRARGLKQHGRILAVLALWVVVVLMISRDQACDGTWADGR